MVDAGRVFEGVARANGPNDLSKELLAPRLLRDEAEVARYVAAFPREQYRVYEVPTVGKFYLEDFDDAIKSGLRRGEIWEPHVHALLADYVEPKSTVLDVGAHIGTHTLTMARLVGPIGRVYAFEPQKKIYRELVHNLELNRIENAVPLRFAIGSHEEIIEMGQVYVPPSGPRNEGGVAVGRGGDPTELRTIDSFAFQNVSVIKIDVERYEDPVIDGAAQTIRANLPVILVEIQGGYPTETAPPEIRTRIAATIAKLKDFGYDVKRLRGEDYIALPKKRVRPSKRQALVRIVDKKIALQASVMAELAHFALDGDRKTRWHSGAHQNGAEALTIDLGTARMLRQVKLELGKRDYDFGRILALDVAEIEGEFTEVLRVRGDQVIAPNLDGSSGEAQRLTLMSPTRARWVRLRQLGQSKENYWSVAELELFE